MQICKTQIQSYPPITRYHMFPGRRLHGNFPGVPAVVISQEEGSGQEEGWSPGTREKRLSCGEISQDGASWNLLATSRRRDWFDLNSGLSPLGNLSYPRCPQEIYGTTSLIWHGCWWSVVHLEDRSWAWGLPEAKLDPSQAQSYPPSMTTSHRPVRRLVKWVAKTHSPSPASSPLWPPFPLTVLQTPCSQSRTKLPPKQKMKSLNKTLPPSFPSPPRSLQPTPWILTGEHFIYTKWIRKQNIYIWNKHHLDFYHQRSRQSPLCSRLLFAMVGLVFIWKGWGKRKSEGGAPDLGPVRVKNVWWPFTFFLMETPHALCPLAPSLSLNLR